MSRAQEGKHRKLVKGADHQLPFAALKEFEP